MLTYTHDGIAVSVKFDRDDAFDGKKGWTWTIAGHSPLPASIAAAPEGQCYVEQVILATGDDLRTTSYDPCDALRTLVSFLSAWAESIAHSGPEGENAHLFPATLLDACAATSWWQWTETVSSDLSTEED